MHLRYCERNGMYYVWDPDDPQLLFDENDKAVPTMACLAGDGKTLDEAIGAAVRNLNQVDVNGILIEWIEELSELKKPEQTSMTGMLKEADATPFLQPSIEAFIPNGYEFVKMGDGKKGELFVDHNGKVAALEDDSPSKCKIIVQRQKFRWRVERALVVGLVAAFDKVEAARLFEASSGPSRVFEVYRVDDNGKYKECESVDLQFLNYPKQ